MIDLIKTIEDYGSCFDEHGDWSDNSVEDYMGLKDALDQIISAFNDGDISPQFGTGSPEGIVTSNYSLKYIDTAVPTEYYNETFESDTGWIAL